MEKTFSAAFAKHLQITGKTVADVSKEADVKRDALYKLNSGTNKNMAVDDAIKVARAFGETVEQFMGLADAQTKSEVEKLIEMLSVQEREILLASIKALLAARNQVFEEPPEDDTSADVDLPETNDQ